MALLSGLLNVLVAIIRPFLESFLKTDLGFQIMVALISLLNTLPTWVQNLIAEMLRILNS